MLEHTDAGNLVERWFDPLESPIVPQLDCAMAIQSGMLNPVFCYLCLFAANRDSLGMHVVFACGVQHEAAPSAPDVQESLERLQPQLSANQLKFLFLGNIERV
jgi:hypothetical protein